MGVMFMVDTRFVEDKKIRRELMALSEGERLIKLFSILKVKKVVEIYATEDGDRFRAVKGKEEEFEAVMHGMIIGGQIR